MKNTLALVLSILLLIAASAQAQVPPLFNYQGRVVVGTTNFDGNGQFKFVLTNGTGSTNYWANDGSVVPPGGQPTGAVSLPVTKGLYSVLLGDATITNMTAIPVSVFANPDLRLRVFFNDGVNGFQQLSPDQRLAPNGYVADGVVTATKIATGAVGTTQLATNLSLGGATTFAGDLNLAATASAASGVLNLGGTPFLHAFGGINADNMFVGSGAGNFALSGRENIGLGSQALSGLTVGRDNIALGYQALKATTTGGYNIAIGDQALFANTTGSLNVAEGHAALSVNTTANLNVAIGSQALGRQSFSNGGTSWDTNNVAVGTQALFNNQPTTATNGFQNTALGAKALLNNTTGASNIAIGFTAGVSLTTGSNNIHIGNPGIGNESNVVRIGGTQTDTFITGVIRGNGTGLAGVALTGAGNTFTVDQTFQGQVIASGSLGCLTLQNRANNAQVWQWRADATGLNCALFPGGSQPMTITPAGKVGVGTATPATALEVNGELTCGSATVNGNLTSASLTSLTGATLGGELFCQAINLTSDRDAKERFKPVSSRAVLAKVARLPISEWQYKARENQPPDDARHIGPMAQDFREAFALGHDDKHITTVDADGVALAAIQGLNEKLEESVQEKDAELGRLRSENRALVARLAAIERRLGLPDENRGSEPPNGQP